MAAIKIIGGTAEAPTVTEKAASGFFEELTSSIMFPLTGAENELLTGSGAFKTAIGWGAIGAVAGGYYARKRAAAGQNPMLGFLF